MNFIDTGAFLARYRRNDQYRGEALRLYSQREDETEALAWMSKYADRRIGFTDCVSFALMKRHGIRTAFTFDRHFRLAGFDVIGLR